MCTKQKIRNECIKITSKGEITKRIYFSDEKISSEIYAGIGNKLISYKSMI